MAGLTKEQRAERAAAKLAAAQVDANDPEQQGAQIGRAVQQECRERSRMPSYA